LRRCPDPPLTTQSLNRRPQLGETKQKRESNCEFGRETYVYVVAFPNQSTLSRSLWWCNTPAVQQRDN
jgi:hypothetical protein